MIQFMLYEEIDDEGGRMTRAAPRGAQASVKSPGHVMWVAASLARTLTFLKVLCAVGIPR